MWSEGIWEGLVRPVLEIGRLNKLGNGLGQWKGLKVGLDVV